MSEQSMWHRIKDKYGHVGHWQRIENVIDKGVPDINFCVAGIEGWIELKEIPHWPRSKYTPVKFRWEKEQRFWARKRGAAGGNVWLLLRVKESKSWLLFWWEDIQDSEFGESLVRKTIRGRATLCVENQGLPFDDFLFTISRGLY
jgi:hypothetical protein